MYFTHNVDGLISDQDLKSIGLDHHKVTFGQHTVRDFVTSFGREVTVRDTMIASGPFDPDRVAVFHAQEFAGFCGGLIIHQMWHNGNKVDRASIMKLIDLIARKLRIARLYYMSNNEGQAKQLESAGWKMLQIFRNTKYRDRGSKMWLLTRKPQVS